MNTRLSETSGWQTASVTRVTEETHRVKTFTFDLPDWRPFRAGQHFDVRLTAPDGYQAERSYSVASSPDTFGVIDLTIELIPDGEVSPFFHEVVGPGDQIELRGPIGGPFTWTPESDAPLLLVGGGSGIVPLMSIIRHRATSSREIVALLLYSSRSIDDVIYREELEQKANRDPNLTVVHTLTRQQPSGWQGHSRRVDRDMLQEALHQFDETPTSYVCGPTPFVETIADALVSLNNPPEKIRTERFGPSG